MGFTMLPSLQTEIADPIQSLQNATTPVYYMCRPGLRSFFLEDMKDWDAVNIVVVSFSIWTLWVWLPKPPTIQLPQSSCFGLVRLKQLFNSELKWLGGGGSTELWQWGQARGACWSAMMMARQCIENWGSRRGTGGLANGFQILPAVQQSIFPYHQWCSLAWLPYFSHSSSSLCGRGKHWGITKVPNYGLLAYGWRWYITAQK